jgi:hypothetical protein
MLSLLPTLVVATVLGAFPAKTYPSHATASGPPTPMSIIVNIDDTGATAPFTPLITMDIYGYFLRDRFQYTCKVGDTPKLTPDTYGEEIGFQHHRYTFDNAVCVYPAGSHTFSVTALSAGATDTDNIIVTAAALPVIISASATHSTFIIPFDVSINATEAGGPGPITRTIDCNHDGSFETAGGTGVSLANPTACPDFTTAGIKTVSIKVTDSAAHAVSTDVQFTALAPTMALQMAPITAGGASPIDTGFNITASGTCPDLGGGVGFSLSCVCDVGVLGCDAPSTNFSDSGILTTTYDTAAHGWSPTYTGAGSRTALCTATCGLAPLAIGSGTVNVSAGTSFDITFNPTRTTCPTGACNVGFTATASGSATGDMFPVSLDCNNDGVYTGSSGDINLATASTSPFTNEDIGSANGCVFPNATVTYDMEVCATRQSISDCFNRNIAVTASTPNGNLVVDRTSLTFTTTTGQNPPSQTVNVSNSTGAQGSTVNWTVTETPVVTWSAASCVGGSTTTEIDPCVITTNSTGVATGSTVATDYVFRNTADATQDRTVHVTLEVQSPQAGGSGCDFGGSPYGHTAGQTISRTSPAGSVVSLTFGGDYPCGLLANGEYWFAGINGNLTVNSKSPALGVTFDGNSESGASGYGANDAYNVQGLDGRVNEYVAPAALPRTFNVSAGPVSFQASSGRRRTSPGYPFCSPENTCVKFSPVFTFVNSSSVIDCDGNGRTDDNFRPGPKGTNKMTGCFSTAQVAAYYATVPRFPAASYSLRDSGFSAQQISNRFANGCSMSRLYQQVLSLTVAYDCAGIVYGGDFGAQNKTVPLRFLLDDVNYGNGSTTGDPVWRKAINGYVQFGIDNAQHAFIGGPTRISPIPAGNGYGNAIGGIANGWKDPATFAYLVLGQPSGMTSAVQGNNWFETDLAYTGNGGVIYSGFQSYDPTQPSAAFCPITTGGVTGSTDNQCYYPGRDRDASCSGSTQSYLSQNLNQATYSYLWTLRYPNAVTAWGSFNQYLRVGGGWYGAPGTSRGAGHNKFRFCPNNPSQTNTRSNNGYVTQFGDQVWSIQIGPVPTGFGP